MCVYENVWYQLRYGLRRGAYKTTDPHVFWIEKNAFKKVFIVDFFICRFEHGRVAARDVHLDHGGQLPLQLRERNFPGSPQSIYHNIKGCRSGSI